MKRVIFLIVALVTLGLSSYGNASIILTTYRTVAEADSAIRKKGYVSSPGQCFITMSTKTPEMKVSPDVGPRQSSEEYTQVSWYCEETRVGFCYEAENGETKCGEWFTDILHPLRVYLSLGKLETLRIYHLPPEKYQELLPPKP